MKLSVVIIAKNEERNLADCLKTVAFADEVVVIDSGSTDRTAAIAVEHGARLVDIQWPGFGPAKRRGVAEASGPWIFSIDADERVSEQLAAEIQAVVQDPKPKAGYYLPRLTMFLGRSIRHGGWYPDPVLRLFQKGKGNFDNALVHERVELIGTPGRLKNHLVHYSYRSLDDYFVKLNRYTTLAAKEAAAAGRKAGLAKILFNPAAKFIKQYIMKTGFLDGLPGLVLAAFSACYVLAKYTKLWHLNQLSEDRPEDQV